MTHLFVKYFEGTSSAEEQKKILAYIKSSPENLNEFHASKEVWKQKHKSTRSTLAWKRFYKTNIKSNRFQHKHLVASLSAACAILLFCISSLLISSQRNNQSLSLTTTAGQYVQVYLPDSTLVLLNSSSTISYHTELAGLRRVVDLNGEAYFQVSKNKVCPFNVYANKVKVHVTGTKFNVKAYAKENITIALEEGSVEASHSAHASDIKSMKPNDVLTYDITKGMFISEDINVSKILSWTEGELYFNNSRVPLLLNALERKYGVAFDAINDPRILNMSISLTIENEGLEKVLDFISFALPIDVNRANERYQIELDTLRYQEIKDKR